MIVWIFQTGEPIPSDGNNLRAMRAMNLIHKLNQHGHEVVLWTSRFSHQDRKHRISSNSIIQHSSLLKIILVDSPGYKRNIGFGRLFDHAILGNNLKRKLTENTLPYPDIAFVGYPPIEFAYIASKWLACRKIPFVVDVKDQWPDIFTRALPRILTPAIKLLLYPYFTLGRYSLRNSTALSSMTDAFLNWAQIFSSRECTNLDFTLPLAPIIKKSSDFEALSARTWTDHVLGSINNKKIIFFVGNFMASAFDFNPVIQAAKLAIAENRPWLFVLAGDGDQWNDIKKSTNTLRNVILTGRINRPQIEAIAKHSVIGLAPIKNNPDYLLSIPNKVVDYLSLGLPVITSLKGEVSTILRKWNAGLTYNLEEVHSLYFTLDELLNNEGLLSEMSNNSRELFQREFDGDAIYEACVERLLHISAQSRGNHQHV